MDFDLDGVNTYTSITLSGSEYQANRVFVAENVLIRNGITLRMGDTTNGLFPLVVMDTLEFEGATAILSAAGFDGSGFAGGPAYAINGYFANGVAGGNGRLGASGDGSGTAGGNTALGRGAAGGAGGGVTGFPGGAAGTLTGPSLPGTLHFAPFNLIGAHFFQGGFQGIRGGSGGGGGSALNGNRNGGGGGAAGAVLHVTARRIIGNGGKLSAKGGNGANGGTGGTGAQTGGGGGGGGGIIILNGPLSNINVANLVFDVAGGTKGLGGNGGSDGVNGSNGTYLTFLGT